jgi:hypothetical protein
VKVYKNLRLLRETHQELYKLKSLAQVAKGKNVTYDELLHDMIAIYQTVIKDLIKKLRVDYKAE